MQFIFSYCEKLKSLNLSNFDNSKVTNMFQMFCGCLELEYLDLSNFGTNEVTNVTSMFLNCRSLRSLNLSSFNTSKIETMENLFYGCSSLNLLDISNFDTSQVTTMYSMFLNCLSLKSLNLSHFKTSKVENMYAMLYLCTSLIFLDVSNFNTSKVTNRDYIFGHCSSLRFINISSFNTSSTTNMEGFFYYCSSLTSLDLSNFDTSNVITMESMFEGCSKLTSLNLLQFKTSNVNIMYNMFYGCSLLTSLDLQNFDISSVNSMESMFDNCENLEYINFKNAGIPQSSINLNNTFHKTALNLVVCALDINLIEKVKENECAIIDCSENWKEKRKKIIIGTNTCANNCTFLNDSFEYNSKCYKNCPSETYRNLFFNLDINNYDINCINSTEGYYLDKDDLFYKQCFSSCKTCDKEGDEVYHNCLECKDDYIFRNNFWNYSNCYNKCLNYLYFDIEANTLRCTDSLECPKNYNKLILNKKECIDNCENDLNYKYEYLNKCYSECPNGTINNSFQCETLPIDEYKIKTTFIEEKNNKIIINIQNVFVLNMLIDNNIERLYYETRINKTLVTFTSTKHFKNISNSNKTTIDLGLCEYILKYAYNISYNNSLYILMLEVEQEGMKINKVEYEVFNIINEKELIKLNLSLCKDTKIETSISVEIEGNIDKYNSSSGYYNDFCYILTSESGTDISLSDRRKEFIDNNLTLCEENCDLIDYDYIYKKAKCSCEIKIHLPLLEDIKFDKEKLKNNFKDINNIANIKFMKCYKIVFTKGNIKSNYGFYILGFIILLFLICLFLFYYKYYQLFFAEMNIILCIFKKDNINEHINTSDKNMNQMNNSDKNFLRFNQILKTENNDNNINSINKNIINIKKKNKRKINYENNNSENKNSKVLTLQDNYFRNKKKLFIPEMDKKEIKNVKNENEFLDYNDSELNSLPYEEALKYDKRTFFQYYISLLKRNHLLLFSFYPNKDYNSRIIKMFLFFFYFSSDFTLNALFFNDETMHNIYKDEGSFGLIYQIPIILYSSLISIIINSLIKFIASTEENIIEIKEEKRKTHKKIFNKRIKRLYKILKIKFILFFVVTGLILLLFWYYITCFCGVYRNTQAHLIKDSFLSFLMSLIYPFAIFLFPGIFRIFALKDGKKSKKLLYKFSQFLENF